METRKYCVYNQTRESFLSLGVSLADTAAKQLKVLMDSLSIQANAGLWLTPFRGVPATKGLTPVDLIYLDEDNRVIQTIESFPNHAIEPTREQPASALVLAGHTIFSTQTQPGDALLICAADEMEEHLARSSNGANGAGFNAVASGSAPTRASAAAVQEHVIENRPGSGTAECSSSVLRRKIMPTPTLCKKLRGSFVFFAGFRQIGEVPNAIRCQDWLPTIGQAAHRRLFISRISAQTVYIF